MRGASMDEGLQMKPFNLERALAGDPVVTRDGHRVTDLRYFNRQGILYPIIGVLEVDDANPEVETWTLYGRFRTHCDSDYDLFMASTKHEGWVNLYYGAECPTLGGIVYPTKEDAERDACRTDIYIGTFKIESDT